MVKIGKVCRLEVVKFTESGAYLDGGPYGEILLPNRYVAENLKEEDEIDVFISFDSEDRIVATTDKPTLIVGEFGLLKCISLTQFGAFLDWGFPKDLFVPFREQTIKMEEGKYYLVRVYVDEKTSRIAASAKINRFLNIDDADYEIGDQVDLIISNRTDLGYNAIINNKHIGMLYANELFKPISTGDKLIGYVKKIREDGKIDLSLEIQGYKKIDPIAVTILDKIKLLNGFLPLTDSSDPEVIKNELGISKKSFKKAIGALYKSKDIIICDDGIRINTEA